MLSVAVILAGCSKDEGGEDAPFIPPVQEQLTQNAYADNESTGGGFSFTAGAAWTASVNEVQSQALSQVSAWTKSAAHATGNDGNSVVWLRLYNGNTEAYSGGAGTVTLRIEMDQNYTGKKREATITVRSGNNTFTVTVVQEGTKHNGSPNEAPVKVTKVSLDKSELSLETGGKATLTATVEPADATIKSVVWSSSAPTVVEVNPVTGEMTAVGGGTATVTATSSSNASVSASCTVTVDGDEPQPQQKLLKKITVTSTDPDDDGSVVTTTYTYDSQRRVSGMKTVNFDGPGTVSQTTYTYESGRITAAYVYTNSEGPGKGSAIYKMAESGYALSAYSEYIQDNDQSKEPETADATFDYDTGWRLTKVTEESDYWMSYEPGTSGNKPVQTKGRDRKITFLTWKDNNITTVSTSEYGDRADTEPAYFYKNTIKYGNEKATMNIDIATGISSMYIPGAYEETIPIYGKMGEYLPVEVKSFSWYKNQTAPTTPDEIVTYKYRINDGYLQEAVVTTTESNPKPGHSGTYTTTYVFEYE